MSKVVDLLSMFPRKHRPVFDEISWVFEDANEAAGWWSDVTKKKITAEEVAAYIKLEYGTDFEAFKKRKKSRTKVQLILKCIAEATDGNTTALKIALANVAGWTSNSAEVLVKNDIDEKLADFSRQFFEENPGMEGKLLSMSETKKFP